MFALTLNHILFLIALILGMVYIPIYVALRKLHRLNGMTLFDKFYYFEPLIIIPLVNVPEASEKGFVIMYCAMFLVTLSVIGFGIAHLVNPNLDLH